MRKSLFWRYANKGTIIHKYVFKIKMMIIRMDPRLTNCAEQSCGLCFTWRNSEKVFLRKRHLNENFDDEESASQKEWEL